MALNMDNLAGAAGEILGEERAFEDDWGMPGLKITGVVLRADHPDWQQHLMDLASGRPEAKHAREVVNERIYAPLAPKGFRRSKATEGEAHARMLKELTETERLKIAVFALRDQKSGIARLLCRSLRINGEREIQRGGQTFDLGTAEGRERFLNHETWESEEGGEKVEFAVGLYQQKGGGERMLDDQGEPIRNREGGWNFGDGLASLILRQAEETEKFVRTRKADALEPSGASSTSSSGFGSRSTSPDDE